MTLNIFDSLERIKEKAKGEESFKNDLIATRMEENPVSAFCKLCTDAGVPLGAMDLIDAGEEAYAAMKRSTNGGGENSPVLAGEDDLYEMFLVELESITS